MDATKLKTRVTGEVDAQRQPLTELSSKIHDNPELGYNENKAADWLTGYLEKNDFSIERGICGLPTAFRARYGQGRPAIALLAEYDALPDIGHACGHNLISTGSVGAGVAARPAIDQCGGSIIVIGTPAEELYGGKIPMVKKGAFKDLDAAMIVHPGSHNNVITRALAAQTLNVEFFGRPAHAAAHPEAGINALEAIIQSFNGINSLRQHIRSTARIHGIITDGGQAANVVPEHSAGTFLVRADDDDYLEELREKVLNCFIGGATATGARLEYEWSETGYATMRNNLTLAKLFAQNMESLGRPASLAEPRSSFGSTDMGNVSQVIPGIHPHIAIAGEDISIHTQEFAAAAASDTGFNGMLDAAKAMAMTIVDLVTDPETVTRVKEEFDRGK